MKRKMVSAVTLTLLLTSMLTFAFHIQPVKASGTIYIRADGSVDPADAPVQRNGDFYTLTGNITSSADGIVIERNNITLDGQAHAIRGPGPGFSYKGIFLSGKSNVTIRNMEVETFESGIYLHQSSYVSIVGNNITNNRDGVLLYSSSNNIISGNNITNNEDGIGLLDSSNNGISGNNITNNLGGIILFGYSSSYNIISGNNITANTGYDYGGISLSFCSNNIISGNNITNNYNGITFYSSSNHKIYHNNFIGNSIQVNIVAPGYSNFWDDGYPSGGNYWSDYVGVDVKNGSNQDLPGSDGIGDAPYIIDADNVDHYPLMNPYGAPPLPTYTLTITTTIGGTTDPAPGTYGYTADSTVQVTAIPGAGYLFDYWELDDVSVGSANPYPVTMGKNHTLKAVFSAIPPPLSVSISPLSASINVGQSVTFTSTVSGGYTPYSYQWYLNGNPVSGATSSSWTFTPTTSGIYYIYLKVIDDKANTSQSETARITVATVPVGGYSIPIQGPATVKPITPYLILTAILTIAFTTIKRKTTKKTKKPP